jgi:hypothetical protein
VRDIGKKASDIDTEIGIRAVGCKNKEQWQNIGISTSIREMREDGDEEEEKEE